VAAGLMDGGFLVALDHVPAPAQDAAAEFAQLIERLRAAGTASRCELTLPVDRLGIAAARALTAVASEGGLRVVLAGPTAQVRSAADGLSDVGIVVPAGRPEAEELCRELAGGRVRLTSGHGAAADLAFVRCLNVLMAASGCPAVASDDPRLVAIAGERAAWNDRPPDSWEYVMSFGIRTDQQHRLVAAGYTVRVTAPSGPGAAMALARRMVGRS